MKCPKCNGPMQERGLKKVNVDYCDACHAYWMDRYAFGHYISPSKSRIDQTNYAEVFKFLEGEPHWAACPVCEAPMLFEDTYDGTPVVYCKACLGAFIHVKDLNALRKTKRAKYVRDTLDAISELIYDIATRRVYWS